MGQPEHLLLTITGKHDVCEETTHSIFWRLQLYNRLILLEIDRIKRKGFKHVKNVAL